MDDLQRINRESQEIARQVGWALSNWTILESNLTHLFRALSGVPDDRRALLTMGAIISFDARMSVINTLMAEHPWDDDKRLIWRRLLNRIQKQQRRRNEIAHFQIINVSDGTVTHARLAPYWAPSSIYAGNRKFLDAKDIQERSLRFRALAVATGWLAEVAKLPPGTPPEDLPPEPDLVPELRRTDDSNPQES